MIYLKTSEELSLMREAGRLTRLILREVSGLVRPGVSTAELDQFAEKRCRDLGVRPAFKGYHGFPGSLCVSLNHEVVHGIPSGKRVVRDGDIVSLDFGVVYKGYYGDTALTVVVGEVPESVKQLLEVTQTSLLKGIEQARVGNRLFDISHAIQKSVEDAGFSVVREFVGHGIGRNLHEDPQVPNFGPPGKGVPLRAGMVLAIEPMVNMGAPAVKVLKDGWTAVTVDDSLSAHFEHTIAITEDGPEILTADPL